jgi:hypothetical protein
VHGVGQPRSTADHDDEDALQTATHVVGGGLLQHRGPERRRHQVGCTAEGQKAERRPEQRPGAAVGCAGGQSEADHRQAPHHDRDDDCQALPAHPRQPSGEDPAANRSGRHRRGQ